MYYSVMPNKDNERGWIKHVLGRLSPGQLKEARSVHIYQHYREHDPTLPKIKTTGLNYLLSEQLEKEALTPGQINELEGSHAMMPDHTFFDEE